MCVRLHVAAAAAAVVLRTGEEECLERKMQDQAVLPAAGLLSR